MDSQRYVCYAVLRLDLQVHYVKLLCWQIFRNSAAISDLGPMKLGNVTLKSIFSLQISSVTVGAKKALDVLYYIILYYRSYITLKRKNTRKLKFNIEENIRQESSGISHRYKPGMINPMPVLLKLVLASFTFSCIVLNTVKKLHVTS